MSSDRDSEMIRAPSPLNTIVTDSDSDGANQQIDHRMIVTSLSLSYLHGDRHGDGGPSLSHGGIVTRSRCVTPPGPGVHRDWHWH